MDYIEGYHNVRINVAAEICYSDSSPIGQESTIEHGYLSSY